MSASRFESNREYVCGHLFLPLSYRLLIATRSRPCCQTFGDLDRNGMHASNHWIFGRAAAPYDVVPCIRTAKATARSVTLGSMETGLALS